MNLDENKQYLKVALPVLQGFIFYSYTKYRTFSIRSICLFIVKRDLAKWHIYFPGHSDHSLSSDQNRTTFGYVYCRANFLRVQRVELLQIKFIY